VGDGSEQGAVPPPPIFWIFYLAMVHFGALWALVLMLVYRRVKQESKSSFVCQLPIGQLLHMADVSSIISYT